MGGRHWHTPPYQAGEGETMLRASWENVLEGVVPKRLDSVDEMGIRHVPVRSDGRAGE